MNVGLLIKILETVAEELPEVVDVVDGWVAGRKAKRVEDVRPPVSHTDKAIADLEAGKP